MTAVVPGIGKTLTDMLRRLGMGEVAQTYKKTALINNKWNKHNTLKPQGLLTFHLKLTIYD